MSKKKNKNKLNNQCRVAYIRLKIYLRLYTENTYNFD